MPDQAISFRPATLDDLSVLLDFEQQVIEAERPHSSTIKATDTKYYDISDLILNEASTLLVAVESNSIIGCGYAQSRRSKSSATHDFHAYLGFMYVAHQHRGKGIIQRLTAQLMGWVKDQDISIVYLDVYASNEPALKAYRKIGFEPALLEMKLDLSNKTLT